MPIEVYIDIFRRTLINAAIGVTHQRAIKFSSRYTIYGTSTLNTEFFHL